MKTNIVLTVLTGILIEIQNKCSSMGCHYPEDDWQAIGIGETLEDAIADVSKDVEARGGIFPSSLCFTDVEFVEYNGEKTILKRGREVSRYYPDTQDEFTANEKKLYSSQAWQDAHGRLDTKRKEAERVANEKKAKETEDNERATLERLKQKYSS